MKVGHHLCARVLHARGAGYLEGPLFIASAVCRGRYWLNLKHRHLFTIDYRSPTRNGLSLPFVPSLDAGFRRTTRVRGLRDCSWRVLHLICTDSAPAPHRSRYGSCVHGTTMPRSNCRFSIREGSRTTAGFWLCCCCKEDGHLCKQHANSIVDSRLDRTDSCDDHGTTDDADVLWKILRGRRRVQDVSTRPGCPRGNQSETIFE